MKKSKGQRKMKNEHQETRTERRKKGSTVSQTTPDRDNYSSCTQRKAAIKANNRK
jgi:hypothetical protein